LRLLAEGENSGKPYLLNRYICSFKKLVHDNRDIGEKVQQISV
jgi:hypothetical protein